MEIIKLNIIPNGTTPTCHASQYDNGRVIRIELYEGLNPHTLSASDEISLAVRKPDNTLVTTSVTNTEADYLDIETTEQMCAVQGFNTCELKIKNGLTVIAMLNFIMQVQPDPTAHGVPSGSALDNLQEQVNECVEVALEDLYDGTSVIFDSEPVANHNAPYTVTSAGIKTALDNAFNFEKTASGSLVHIEDGSDNIPVKSLVSEIVAVESGNGQPKSPTNPYTISGFSNGIITRCGKNLIDDSKYYQLNANIVVVGQTEANANRRVYLPKGTYTIKVTSSVSATIYYDYGNGSTSLGNTSDARTFTLSENSYCSFWLYKSGGFTPSDYTTIQLEVGTATTYEAYNGTTYTFAFGQTVYGGHFDNKGNLVVTHGSYTFDGTETPIAYGNGYRYVVLSGKEAKSYGQADIPNLICNEYNAITRQQIQNGTTGISITGDTILLSTNTPSDVQVVYELATPITLSITSQDIPTLLGENNIFSNCGDIEVNYYTNKANDILDFIDSEIGKKNGTNILIEEGSQDSIKDYVDDEVSTINTSLSNKAGKTEDTTITLASGYSLISSSCGKTDRLVHLNFNVEKTGGFATGWQAIGTTEFKPNTLAYCPLWNVTNGVGNGEVRIDTDGTINFYIVTAGELRLNANIGYVTD